MLRDGIPVQVRKPNGSIKDERVAVIDWVQSSTNDFFVASQVWIESSLYKRRPDAIGFVNGIPLLLIEWKDLTQPVQEAYEANLRDYRDTIPRLFDFNGFTILSNGLDPEPVWNEKVDAVWAFIFARRQAQSDAPRKRL
jgi:type I restriction enzyme R subunit